MSVWDGYAHAGETIVVKAFWFGASGSLMTGLSPVVSIADNLSGALLVDGAAMAESTSIPGIYYYTYTTATAGVLTCRATSAAGDSVSMWLVGSGAIPGIEYLDAPISSMLDVSDISGLALEDSIQSAIASLTTLLGRITDGRAAGLDNLPRLDDTISSRLASIDYVAPPASQLDAAYLDAALAPAFVTLDSLMVWHSDERGELIDGIPARLDVIDEAIAEVAGGMSYTMAPIQNMTIVGSESMTPSRLIDVVKSELVPVCYLDDGQLESYMRKALYELHESVGCKKVLTIQTGTTAAIPADFHEIATGYDSRKKWVDVQIGIGQDADGNNIAMFNVVATPGTYGPYTVEYFINLAGLDMVHGVIPNGMATLLWDFFKALVEKPNTIRARSVARATGRNDDFPSDEALDGAISAAREAMKNAAAMSMSVVVGV